MPISYLLAALFVAEAVSCSASAPEHEEKAAAARVPAKAPEVALMCSLTRAGPIGPRLRIKGTCAFPDKTVLRISSTRGREVERGGRLEFEHAHAGEGLVEVSSGTFETEFPLDGLGIFRFSVILEEEFQRPALVKELRDRFQIRRWEFEENLSSDALLESLKPDLAEVEALAKEMARLFGKAEVFCQSKELWETWSPEIKKEAGMLAARIDKLRLANLFPAATGHLEGAWCWLQSHSNHFFWKPDSRFGGAFNVDEGKWVRIARGIPFTFDGMKDHLKHAVEVADREFALWILKDARRAGRREALIALARGGPSPLSIFAKRFEGGEDLAKLEDELRGERRETTELPEPPPPAQFRELIAARERLEEARELLQRADRLWSEPESFAIYKRLLKEYPDALEKLRARGRVVRRAQQED
jgi:hypothetical protein